MTTIIKSAKIPYAIARPLAEKLREKGHTVALRDRSIVISTTKPREVVRVLKSEGVAIAVDEQLSLVWGEL